jgi:molecular chaperone DnaK (HSP70)
VDGQTTVAIHVVQGERELVADCRSLARFNLKDLPPLPAGVPKIEVEFIIDANGILNVRAQELRTLKAATIQVNPSYGLNDEQVEKMLSDSFEFAESDFERRFLIEARVEGESLLRSARKSAERGQHLLSDTEKFQISAALKNLESQLSSAHYKDIRTAMDKLNEATQKLAEDLMNEAVQNALKDKELV